MRNQVSKSQAIIEFKKMFDIGNNQSMYNDDSFLINKSDFTRHQVISKLCKWFENNKINGYYVIIKPITLLYTRFEILTNKYKNEEIRIQNVFA